MGGAGVGGGGVGGAGVGGAGVGGAGVGAGVDLYGKSFIHVENSGLGVPGGLAAEYTPPAIFVIKLKTVWLPISATHGWSSVFSITSASCESRICFANVSPYII